MTENESIQMVVADRLLATYGGYPAAAFDYAGTLVQQEADARTLFLRAATWIAEDDQQLTALSDGRR